MDVGYTAMRHWVKQLKSEQTGTTPTAKAFTDEQKKIQALEVRIPVKLNTYSGLS
jgi:transposase